MNETVSILRGMKRTRPLWGPRVVIAAAIVMAVIGLGPAAPAEPPAATPPAAPVYAN